MARCLFGIVVLATFGLAGTVAAKVDCDPAKPYWITPEDGGWTICTASFSGDLSCEARTRPGARDSLALRAARIRLQSRLRDATAAAGGAAEEEATANGISRENGPHARSSATSADRANRRTVCGADRWLQGFRLRKQGPGPHQEAGAAEVGAEGHTDL